MQAQTRVQQQQQQQAGRPLFDLVGGSFGLPLFDRGAYLEGLAGIDFASMDATQSVKELLRLREGLLTRGLP
jgi:hypothetical protein